VLWTNPDSAIDTGDQRTSTLLAYELLPFSTESDPGPHAYSLSGLHIPLGKSRIGLYCLPGESKKYVNPFLRDLAHIAAALLTSQDFAST